MLPRKLTTELGPDATKQFGFGLDGQPKKFGHGAASAATFSVDVEQKFVVVMTRNKMAKNYGKLLEAITAGLEPLKGSPRVSTSASRPALRSAAPLGQELLDEKRLAFHPRFFV